MTNYSTVMLVAAYLWCRFASIRYLWVSIRLGVISQCIALGSMFFLGVNYLLATTAGYIFHFSVGFFWDRRVSFQSLDTAVPAGGSKYLIAEAMAYLATIVVMYVAVDILSWSQYWSRISIGTAVGTSVAFMVNKNWTFKN